MVVDCFCFFNEIDLLFVRLRELYPYVDKFVLVEAQVTQSLVEKPFYFEENKAKFTEFLDKIVHIKIPKNECVNNNNGLWEMENFQRNCINIGLKSLELSDDDIILISDLDEIPRHERLDHIKNILYTTEHGDSVISLELDFFAYFLNLKASNRNWIGTTACKYGVLKKVSPQVIRNHKDYFPLIQNAGWHFSWLGGYEKVYEKSLSCIEPFDKSQLPKLEDFREFFENFKNSDNKFFIHLEQLDKKETPFHKCVIDNSFPLEISSNMDKYNKYIL